jgi:hypothetical protein
MESPGREKRERENENKDLRNLNWSFPSGLWKAEPELTTERFHSGMGWAWTSDHSESGSGQDMSFTYRTHFLLHQHSVIEKAAGGSGKFSFKFYLFHSLAVTLHKSSLLLTLFSHLWNRTSMLILFCWGRRIMSSRAAWSCSETPCKNKQTTTKPNNMCALTHTNIYSHTYN